MRVLIAEDEPRLAEALARGLRRTDAPSTSSHDGNAARSSARPLVDYDAVVLDRDLPRRPRRRGLPPAAPAPSARRGSSCSPPRPTSRDASRGSSSAPTTTSPSRSPSPRSWRGCTRCSAAATGRPRSRARARRRRAWTRRAARSRATGARSTLSPKEFGVLRGAAARRRRRRQPARRCSSASGTSTSTRSPTRSA